MDLPVDETRLQGVCDYLPSLILKVYETGRALAGQYQIDFGKSHFDIEAVDDTLESLRLEAAAITERRRQDQRQGDTRLSLDNSAS